MIGIITGTIDHLYPKTIIMTSGGVGYSVYLTNKTISSVSPGSVVTVFTHTHLREDAIELYGFREQTELSLFELLISVSGVGPKTALGVIDKGVQEVIHAISTNDVTFFTTVPRLGKKNAQKIIIELKTSIEKHNDLLTNNGSKFTTENIHPILLSMGFTKQEIDAIYSSIDKTLSLEEQIRTSLKLLASR